MHYSPSSRITIYRTLQKLTRISNVNEKGDFNIIHSDSFSIWSLPYMTCNSGQKYWANITAIDSIGTSYLKVSGIVWGIGDACQFLQGSINCNP